MNTSKISPNIWLCFTLIIFAALSRLIPHPYNFTPIGALGLFAGAYLVHRSYWLIPLIALLISDFIIGFYHPFTMGSVYLSFFISAVIGHNLLLGRIRINRIISSSLLVSIVFFLLSNFGDWLSGINYPVTFDGLVTCYIMAIPFFNWTVAGDLIYAVLLFGIYEVTKYQIGRLHSADI